MRDYCDRLFRQRIRERDVTCRVGNLKWGVYCGGPLEVAHFIGRGKSYAVRWSDDNAALLCRNHHAWIDGHDLDKFEWVRSFLGDERYEALREASRHDWNKDYDAALLRL